MRDSEFLSEDSRFRLKQIPQRGIIIVTVSLRFSVGGVNSLETVTFSIPKVEDHV